MKQKPIINRNNVNPFLETKDSYLNFKIIEINKDITKEYAPEHYKMILVNDKERLLEG